MPFSAFQYSRFWRRGDWHKINIHVDFVLGSLFCKLHQTLVTPPSMAAKAGLFLM